MAVTPTTRPTIAAEAFLRALADHGTDYFFANPGTDFPPIVEAFSRAKKTNAKVPQAGAGAAREPRGRHGARRLSDERPAAGGDGARQCRHRQHDQQSHQPVARPRAADPRRRAHADHREGLVRLAHAADPLGAGDVRPGRHAARAGEVGLRIAHAGPGRRRRRARQRSGDGASARTGLSRAAARTACRRRCRSRSAPAKPRPHAAARISRSESDRNAWPNGSPPPSGR